MNYLPRSKFMPLVMAGMGIVGFFLRSGLYHAALDHKNLLLAGHPLQWLLFLATAVAALLALLYARGKDLCGFPQGNILSAAGCLVLAAGIVITLLPEGFSGSGLSRMRNLLGVLTAGALVWGSVRHFRGQPMFFLVPGICCIFFAVHMVSCYQTWSSNPQILDYLYTLLASVTMMLFAYQQSACAADCGSAPLARLFGILSIFCGITALSGTEYPGLYLTGSLWALAQLLGSGEVPAELE